MRQFKHRQLVDPDAVGAQLARDRIAQTAFGIMVLDRQYQVVRRLGRAFVQGGESDIWKQYARVLLSSNEFAYVD